LVTSSSTGIKENTAPICTEQLTTGQRTLFTNRIEEYFLPHYNLLPTKDWKRTSGVHLSGSSDSHDYE
jgi:hypothetical protein